MSLKPALVALSALVCIGAALPAAAQTVYKCGSKRSVRYSDQPCAGRTGRVVNTDDAPVPVESTPDEGRVLARAMHRRPDETARQFATRRRRARLLPQDRAECARIDTRMPVERASMDNPDPDEVANAKAALERSRKRFTKLGC